MLIQTDCWVGLAVFWDTAPVGGRVSASVAGRLIDDGLCTQEDLDRVYWAPALTLMAADGIASAVGIALVYDSCVRFAR